jgi:hypothetical protein
MKHLPLALVTAALAACGASPASPAPMPADASVRDGSADASSDAPDTAVEPVEGRAFRWLLGRFDSRTQSLTNPQYFAIEVQACRVSAQALGARVLYLEQSRIGMAPYRQRVYVVEAEGTAGTEAVSRVFELNDPTRFVGACADPSNTTVSADDLIERAGCAVHLTWQNDRFTGTTRGRECESTLMGASYATSEVELRADGFTSWDRGFNTAGQQVWGATAGPYRFVRRTPVEP